MIPDKEIKIDIHSAGPLVPDTVIMTHLPTGIRAKATSFSITQAKMMARQKLNDKITPHSSSG